jgi:hypothetical protein
MPFSKHARWNLSGRMQEANRSKNAKNFPRHLAQFVPKAIGPHPGGRTHGAT